jgi:hypothetical protein
MTFCILELVTGIETQSKKNVYHVSSDQERGNDYAPLWPHHHNIQWAISE